MAKWSVLSLSIKYCGSSFEAWTLYPLNVIFEVTFFLIVPRTRPASEFHSTWSPTLKSFGAPGEAWLILLAERS
jgi:hypothetical protein